jgi:hypothetical protein
MAKDIVFKRGLAFSIECPYCKAPPNAPCTHINGQCFQHTCKFCGAKRAYAIHETRGWASERLPALWHLACQAEGASTDAWIADYEGDSHAFFCPNKKGPD